MSNMTLRIWNLTYSSTSGGNLSREGTRPMAKCSFPERGVGVGTELCLCRAWRMAVWTVFPSGTLAALFLFVAVWNVKHHHL